MSDFLRPVKNQKLYHLILYAGKNFPDITYLGEADNMTAD